jgi:phage-related protein
VSWNIEYYSSNSNNPIEDFIRNLNYKTKAKVAYSFDLLEEFGLNLRMPHVKKLSGTPLWELRIIGKASIRFFYIAKSGKKFLILHGFIKRLQKTPKKEIRIALARLYEFQNKH